MLLSGKTIARWRGDPFVVRVSSDPSRPEPLRSNEALLMKSGADPMVPGFRAYFDLTGPAPQSPPQPGRPFIPLPSSFSYLADGDIVSVKPTAGDLRVLYRKSSRHNSLVVQRGCNNFCVMCSQPPQKAADDDSCALAWQAIPLMDINTPEITFTGGEPTLLGRKLVDLIHRAKNFLPRTGLHILTNGRLLKFLAFAKDIADVRHRDLVLGIPIYSDASHEHDFVVQSKGAFDDTVRGILNAARCELKVEIRVVITRVNFMALSRLAEFISRNFPFSCNVALMGLEPTGLARANMDAVWIDPVDYAEQLRAAAYCLDAHGVPVSIYNHQLCTLGHDLWPFAKQSISDWKDIFLDECQACSARQQCCGFFASAHDAHSRAIRAIPAPNGPESPTLADSLTR